MKKEILVILFYCIFSIGSTQTMQDVVYLKNGTVIKGTILELAIGDSVKIRTADRNELVFVFSEIEKITKEPEYVTFGDYGGPVSIGFGFGGGGLVHVPLRFYPLQKFCLEVGATLQPVIVSGERLTVAEYSLQEFMIAFTGGVNIFVDETYQGRREKIKFDGVAVNGGYGSGNYVENYFISVGWLRETFRKGNRQRSFVGGLGVGYLFENWKPGYESSRDIPFMLYWRVSWNSFLSK
ncbi:MAG: hypothetical protein ACNA7V_01085 [Bacteroidales bacterium]